MQLVSSKAANIHSESTLKTDLPIPMAREKYCLMNFKTTASERLSWRINTISKESYKQLNVPNHIDPSWNEIPRDPRKVQNNRSYKREYTDVLYWVFCCGQIALSKISFHNHKISNRIPFIAKKT